MDRESSEPDFESNETNFTYVPYAIKSPQGLIAISLREQVKRLYKRACIARTIGRCRGGR